MSTHTESDRILTEAMRKNPSAAIFAVFIVLAIFGFCFCVTFGTIHRPEPTPIAEIMGDHGDYKVDGGGVNAVYVVIGTRDPQRYIKALQDSIVLVEKTSGRKIVSLAISGCPSRVSFSLEKAASE